MDILTQIKRLVARGDYRLTHKATVELHLDGLVPQDAVEAILTAHMIKKTSRGASHRRE